MAKDNKERIYYIRKMSSTIIPSETEKRELYNLANNIPFDDRVNHEADLTDLNITLIQSYLKEIESSLYQESKNMELVDLCRSMNIVSTLPEYVKPKNVGLMFFSLEPERFFPYAQIDVVEFPDDTGDRIREKTFKGPLHQQLREALLYIKNSILQGQIVKVDGIAEARRFFNYPYAAVEEALSNAVYHKGYDEREPIEVRVESDRIIIVSYPGADRSISIEGRNTGLRKIRNALRSNGSPEPVFETDDERTYFSTTLYIHSAFRCASFDHSQNEAVNEAVNEALSKNEKAAFVFSFHPSHFIIL